MASVQEFLWIRNEGAEVDWSSTEDESSLRHKHWGLALTAIEQYESGGASYPHFVFQLGMAVDAAEARDDPLAGTFRRLWGELEIINALAEQRSHGATQAADVLDLIARIRSLVVG
jgi:hypothetical protein